MRAPTQNDKSARQPDSERRADSRTPEPFFGPLRSLFNRKLVVERRGLHLNFVLAPKPDAPVEPEAAPSRGAALRRDHQQLVRLLGQQPDLRHTMRHLAAVEQALAQFGSRSLSSIPGKILSKAQEQLEGLRRDDPTFVLPELSRRLKQIVDSMKARGTDFAPTEAMLVSEASHSLFDEMERSWDGRMPEAS